MFNQEDEKLIAEAKKNSKDFQKLYDKYYQKIFNYFWFRNGHDKASAEDLMQEVFIKAFRKLPGFNLKDCSYLTYLLTIAHNLLVNYYRDTKRASMIKLEKVPIHIIKYINDAVDAELMWKEIYKLPLIQRDILLLRFRRELPIKEIAKIVGKSENAVKLTLCRAKAKLKNIAELTILAQLPGRKKVYTKPKFIK
jgi:RNA polymerase sigma factor (sigma-70 family)